MIDDDWVRLQVYIPEILRYKLRTAKPMGLSDSRAVRDVLMWILTHYSEDDLKEIWSYSETPTISDSE